MPLKQPLETHLPYALLPGPFPAPLSGVLKPDRSRATKTGQITSQLHDFNIILVEVLEEVHAFTDGRVVILNRRGTWHLDSSIPT
jgi:hypothetical protein